MHAGQDLKGFFMVCLALVMVASVALPVRAEGEAVSKPDPAVRGTTGPSLIVTGETEGEMPEAAPVRPRRVEPLSHIPSSLLSDSGWVLIDVDSFFSYIPVGQACAVRFDHTGDSLEVILPSLPLTQLARQAIEYAPDWLALELRDAFARMDSSHQDVYAGIILGTSDPIVDEVAFVVAHTATEVLQSANFYTQLLTENAEDVYAHDPYLPYADIVDYGSALTGGDYYSTILYRTAETGDTVEIELPRDRYYWDVVHPKITDEFPTYINPATGYAAAPPVGRFWREFLFTHADSGYQVLRDVLADSLVLWRGNVDSRANGAIGGITQWILDVMDFGSGAERPIQPVRIYHKHLGRCGEHADITCAAARAALIATNSPLAIASDHTWNEFYDQRWVHWEPVNIYVDSPWHYEGWGKVFLGIFDWRGDDWIWTVTDLYTPHCTLTVEVTDSLGYPVDGAQVTVALKTGTVTYIESAWASTDHRGLCQFLLGDDNDIYARIDSDLGTVPPGPLYKRAVQASVPGEHYVWSRSVPEYRPQLPVIPAVPPPGPSDQYQLRINWQTQSEFCYGQNRIDNNTFSDHLAGGAVAFFICDQANYTAYAASDSFYAYEIMDDADSAQVAFTVPAYDTWYAVLSNQEHVVNSQVVHGVAELYQRVAGSVADGHAERSGVTALAQNRPNPFRPYTSIAFSLGADTELELAIYDISGRRVITLASGVTAAGDHRVRWDGTDSRGTEVAPGIYLCRLRTPEASLCRKMVLAR